MKKFLAEFKKFALRGNVMDLAIGVIIGGAFTGIVNALSDNFIKPLLNCFTGADTFANMWANAGAYASTFMTAIVNFIITAFVLFMIIKALNKAKAAVAKPEEEVPAEPEADPADIALLKEIRDLLKEQK